MLPRIPRPYSLAAAAILSAMLAFPQTAAPKRSPDVPYVPSTEEAVQAMLELAAVKKTDIVYDLGCGDGRIVIAAAKTSARTVLASTSIPNGSRRQGQTPGKRASSIWSASRRRTCSKPTSARLPWSPSSCFPP
jgi:hypothetical protein